MNTPELIQWLKDNSSGDYRPSREAAELLEKTLKEKEALISALEKFIGSSDLKELKLMRETMKDFSLEGEDQDAIFGGLDILIKIKSE